MEACSFRDALPRFEGINAVVLGISADSVESHAKFKRKYELPYTLLADEDHSVCDLYGVWVEKSMYGKKYWGFERSTFVIGPDGKVARAMRGIRAAGHAAQVLQEVQAAK